MHGNRSLLRHPQSGFRRTGHHIQQHKLAMKVNYSDGTGRDRYGRRQRGQFFKVYFQSWEPPCGLEVMTHSSCVLGDKRFAVS